ncbi:hypothetical protein EB796_016218 [Bugula neritina]|uniref:BZIP domain-containing protein n=1 Tax=Bugula neritina TaxID=10212 RepID=A0A7J7JIM2_BUGNE|nr:hypothetical protein EB796_016218 [Bugula neritina]
MSSRVTQMPNGKEKPRRKWPEKNTEEYSEKRSQNNVAVKKSREKARLKQQESKSKVEGLKKENSELEVKVETLQKELTILKDLFTAHANGTAASVSSNNMNTNRSFHQSEDPVSLDHVYSSPSSKKTVVSKANMPADSLPSISNSTVTYSLGNWTTPNL